MSKQITTKWVNPETLPLVIEPVEKNIQLREFLELLDHNQALFKEYLLKCGGLLFRNFPLKGAEDFATVVHHLNDGQFLEYIGGDSPRTEIQEGIYTSTEAPSFFKIPLHQELSYIKKHPNHIFFFCEIAPKDRGETILADGRKIYQALDPQVKKRFEEKKLLYFSSYNYRSKLLRLIKGHKSWTEVFQTNSKEEVEKKCRERDLSFAWQPHDWLQISEVGPAIKVHPKTQEVVWFNQAHHFDLNPRFLGWWRYLGSKILYYRKYMKIHEVRFADGTPIPREDIYHIFDVLDANTISIPWQKGDLLVLDNILAMHGRAPFTGKRRILTAMM